MWRGNDLKKYHHEYPQRAKEAGITMRQEQMQLKTVMQATKTFSKLKKKYMT